MENTDSSNGYKIMDGCTAAAYAAYAFSDVATVYPITPVAEMGDTAGRWASGGIKNLFGQTMVVKEMESELGAAGAVHGALAAGALATTFTASQGLMLMIPNMYKIAGELLPAVFHVGTRSLAAHALSIFGDHQDAMACRATGFAFLVSSTVQEAQDLGMVAHLAAISGSLPVCHMFDGWRTSNQMATIRTIPYEQVRPLLDTEAVRRFRQRAMNPEHPDLRGSAQNPDVYFQNREAANRYYDAFPAIVSGYMERLGELTGRRYRLFDYCGPADADMAVVVMGSAGEVAEQTAAMLEAKGYKAGVVKVRLYRPFCAQALMEALPNTVRRLTVLDRTKEPGAGGEPLFKDVAAAVLASGRPVEVYGGRYGLSSKEFDPAMAKAVFDNMRSGTPKREFTVGIDDDVTHLSLPFGNTAECVPEQEGVQARFYGFGSDGTVGATRQAARVISDTLGYHVQAFFEYSAKKSGGYTISQLRVARQPVRAEYGIEQADYVACHKDRYVKQYPLARYLRHGGIFVLNSAWGTVSLMERHLPARLRRELAAKGARLYNVDAAAIAAATGLGARVNMIMEVAFLHLMRDRFDFDKALAALKQEITAAYRHEGNEMVERNMRAIEMAQKAVTAIDYPASWASAADDEAAPEEGRPAFVRDVADVCNRLEGDSLPVSALVPDGKMPMGTTAWEKRRIALSIPRWDPDKCIECALCSLVCPHAAIRPFLLTAGQKEKAPESLSARPAKGTGRIASMMWRIQVFAEDCTGCGSCAAVCPGRALEMVLPHDETETQIPLLAYLQEHVGYNPGLLPRFTVRGSQLYQPLLEFSGACGGCGETPYVKLLTQLFGERMLIANATGCSSIWGANFPSNAYCTNNRGHGPAWGNSLFEDNAEYGYGMAVAVESRRELLAETAAAIAAHKDCDKGVAAAINGWLAARSDADGSAGKGEALMQALKPFESNCLYRPLLEGADLLVKKSVWAIGGDGWAYDIGFAGLDHVLARRTDLNLLVMDTECYSNTGGQMSKATPIGAVARYAVDGKRTYKKDLGRMMMTYGNVYVASISLGADPQQAVTALKEAESYPGPSLVIAYCPCINHGIRGGMGNAMAEERKAVLTGYWPLYRYNPLNTQSPLTVDSKTPDGRMADFLDGEDRYADLRMLDPKEAAVLQPELERRSTQIYDILKNMEKPV